MGKAKIIYLWSHLKRQIVTCKISQTIDKTVLLSTNLKPRNLIGTRENIEGKAVGNRHIIQVLSEIKWSNLIHFILYSTTRLRAAYLSELCFDFSNVRDPMLQDIAAIKHLCLCRLSLVSCRDITDLGLVTLINSQPSLVSVDLSQLTDISAKVGTV